MILLSYVNDIILTGNDKPRLEELKNKLKETFKMTDLGEPKKFLGIKIERNREKGELTISQQQYIESMLKRFKMDECNPQSTPTVTRQVAKRDQNKLEASKILKSTGMEKNVPYREAIGSLLYLAGATKPDIAFAVNYLARYQQNPTEEDWMDVKRTLRYLRGTAEIKLTYKGKSEDMDTMTDASFRDCSNSTSTSGYVIRLFGDAIAWRSHKQTYVSLSTCQAEYLAMSEACQELISLDKAIRDMIGKTFYPINVWCDNNSACDCAQKHGCHKLKSFDDDVETIRANLEERERTGTKKHVMEIS